MGTSYGTPQLIHVNYYNRYKDKESSRWCKLQKIPHYDNCVSGWVGNL